MTADIKHGHFERHDIGRLAEQIQELIDAYDAPLSVAEVVGALELVKVQIIMDHIE